MSVNNIDPLPLKEPGHGHRGEWVDLKDDAYRRVLPTKLVEILDKGFALESDKLNVVTGFFLSFGEGHHAVDGPIDHPSRARDMGNPQLSLFTHSW